MDSSLNYKGYNILLPNGFDQIATVSWLELEWQKTWQPILEAKVVETTLFWKNSMPVNFISQKGGQSIQVSWITFLCY